ncbi:uncharacterized protein BJ171DRAFT_205291 [Polychytrium aggregatum]|uniref:uncharacterized protein n=1 Tax=Polychytrium aggregatum TaxID=110093 RepID=UPI0022FEFFD1|nr:uncharacterized protein BJ171DRAFT_205291 [Polychytrium aggregatum]KAI9199622.1 hypothetical protein BJ171DRAFT_205291 [Polychytrium aggregatum]
MPSLPPIHPPIHPLAADPSTAAPSTQPSAPEPIVLPAVPFQLLRYQHRLSCSSQSSISQGSSVARVSRNSVKVRAPPLRSSVTRPSIRGFIHPIDHIAGHPTTVTEVLVDSVELNAVDQKHAQVISQAAARLQNRLEGLEHIDMAGAVEKMVEQRGEQRTAAERWKYALETTLSGVKAVRAFRNREIEEKATPSQGVIDSTFIANKIGFSLEDYRAQRNRFDCGLSRDTRQALKKDPKDYSQRDVDLLFHLTSSLPAFSKYNTAVRKALCRVTKFEAFKQGRVIVKEGHEAQNFYFIASGQVEIRKQIEGQSILLNVLKTGDSFGELALLQNVRRSATVITLMDTELLRVNKDDFLEVLRTESEKDLHEKVELLQSIPLFQMLSRAAIIHLAATSQSRDYVADQVITTEGEVPQSIVVIKEGYCRLVKAVRFLRVPWSKAYPDRFKLVPCPEGFGEKPKPTRQAERTQLRPGNVTFLTATQFVEPVVQPPIVNRVLKIKDCSVGETLFAVSAVVQLGTPNIVRHLNMTMRQERQAKRAPFSILSNGRVKILLINRGEFARVATAEMAETIGAKHLDDSLEVWHPQKLQHEYINARRWKLHKAGVISELVEKRDLDVRERVCNALPRIA